MYGKNKLGKTLQALASCQSASESLKRQIPEELVIPPTTSMHLTSFASFAIPISSAFPPTRQPTCNIVSRYF